MSNLRPCQGSSEESAFSNSEGKKKKKEGKMCSLFFTGRQRGKKRGRVGGNICAGLRNERREKKKFLSSSNNVTREKETQHSDVQKKRKKGLEGTSANEQREEKCCRQRRANRHRCLLEGGGVGERGKKRHPDLDLTGYCEVEGKKKKGTCLTRYPSDVRKGKSNSRASASGGEKRREGTRGAFLSMMT